MTEQSLQRLRAVYLLHWIGQAHQPEHYVGITEHARLEDRMREHAAGRGSRRTAHMARTATGFDLAQIFTTYNPALETTLIAMGARLATICPICQGCDPIRSYRPTKRAAGLLPPLASDQSLIALHVATTREPMMSKKKGGAEAATPLPRTVP